MSSDCPSRNTHRRSSSLSRFDIAGGRTTCAEFSSAWDCRILSCLVSRMQLMHLLALFLIRQDIARCNHSSSSPLRDESFGLRLAHRACAARLSISLRSSGLTFRHLAAPKPTACLLIGDGESFRLAISRISSARSSRTSGGKPLCFMMRRSVIVRRTPIAFANSAGITENFGAFTFGVDMRMLVRFYQYRSTKYRGRFPCPANLDLGSRVA